MVNRYNVQIHQEKSSNIKSNSIKSSAFKEQICIKDENRKIITFCNGINSDFKEMFHKIENFRGLFCCFNV